MEFTPSKGDACMTMIDSYTYVKGVYDTFCSQRKQHHLIECQLYARISDILVLLESPVIDVWVKETTFYDVSFGVCVRQ